VTELKSISVSEFLEASFEHIKTPDTWLKGALHDDAYRRHCSIGALDQERDRLIRQGYHPAAVGEVYGKAADVLTEPGGRFTAMPIMRRNDRPGTTHRTLRSWWNQAIETAKDREGISRRALAAADLRRRFGFPRHLEMQHVQAHESDLAISGD